MKLRELFDDLFAKAMVAAKPDAVARPSERKPAHGHESRLARRTLGRPSMSSPRPPRRFGDPVTTGRVETSSQRKHRRRREARCRAGGHEVRLVAHPKHGSVPVGCRCGEVGG